MPDAIDAEGMRDLIRAMLREELLHIGIYVDDADGESLRRVRGNFEWLDRQARNTDEIRAVFEWSRDQKARSEEHRAEFRRALIHRSAEWLWHILSAAIAGTVTYVFTTRGHS